ncbi:MAG TPA: carboxylating nicotinate-nucleotide diphosphorylase [Acidimicrobiia bacterium]
MTDLDAPRHLVREAVARAINEDLGPLGDLTSALLPPHTDATGAITARAAGVLAGQACATETWAQLDTEVDVRWTAADGCALTAGTVVATIAGPLRSVLTGERTALNFLCHLSGIATLTQRFVAEAGDQIRIWDTRKTTPGLRALEKAAVRAGGGVNHRGNLSDMVLIKDNHLAGLSIDDAVRTARDRWPGRGIEVECEQLDQVHAAVAAGADLVMLDNLTPDQARACIAAVRTGPRPDLPVEVSGGITLDTVAAYASTGADLISTSVITQSAPALDLGLDLHDPDTR